MKKTNASFAQRWNETFQSAYGTPSIALVRGKGVDVYDVEDNRYLDFLGGIATNVLGHAHPKIVKAVSRQIGILSHTSNFYSHPQVVELAEKLKAMTGQATARTFFCNSGAEANEAAIKLSRLTGRHRIVAAHGAFHGRTMGALSLTGQPAKREPFKPLLKKISHVPYGDVKKLARAVNKKTAMVILEPIMGEAGVIVPDDNYLKSAREICDKHGALLVLDAVQTGMGRTGTWFGYEDSGITPDVITIAKGLGGGLPIGAMIALGRAAELITPGSHGSTFGGNPISCAAGNATIEEIESKKYMKTNRQFGLQIMSALRQIPGISDVRGKGLLIGFDFSKPIAKKIASELQNRGVLVNAASETTIRIAPAFVITQKNVDEFLRACREVVTNHG